MSDNRRRFTDQRYIHFVTFSVFHRRRLLNLDHPKRIVLGTLNHLLEALAAKCVGFVVMPDHVHALIWLNDSAELVRFMHGWKRISSFNIRRWYAVEAPNYFADFGPGEHLWQPKYYPFQIFSQQKLREKLEYIHKNPVRAGLVPRAVDWPWSSARWYYEQRSVGVPLEWIEI